MKITKKNGEKLPITDARKYLDAEEEYREMEGETYELSTQYFRNLTGKEYIEDFQDQVLYDQLFKIAAPVICIQYAK